MSDEATLQVVLGGGEGEYIAFAILGPTCPNAAEDWYKAQLNVEIRIVVGEFHGYRRLVMFSDDWHLCERRIVRYLSGDTHRITLESADFFTLHVFDDAKHGFHAWIQLDALEESGERVLRDNGEENWEWRIPIQPDSLTSLLQAVRQVTARYPFWSVGSQSTSPLADG